MFLVYINWKGQAAYVHLCIPLYTKKHLGELVCYSLVVDFIQQR